MGTKSAADINRWDLLAAMSRAGVRDSTLATSEVMEAMGTACKAAGAKRLSGIEKTAEAMADGARALERWEHIERTMPEKAAEHVGLIDKARRLSEQISEQFDRQCAPCGEIGALLARLVEESAAKLRHKSAKEQARAAADAWVALFPEGSRERVRFWMARKEIALCSGALDAPEAASREGPRL